ncbi:LysR substrate-binding domain-containing protein [Gemmobacter lanyuensis]
MHGLLCDPFVVVAPAGVATGPEALRALPMIRYSARHHMGRQISAHLAAQNLSLTSRFELDSYHAILAMVAAGQGWSILTPLALHHVARFRRAVQVAPLPFGGLERRITLSARAGPCRTCRPPWHSACATCCNSRWSARRWPIGLGSPGSFVCFSL